MGFTERKSATGSNGNKRPFAFLLQEEKPWNLKNVLLLLFFISFFYFFSSLSFSSVGGQVDTRQDVAPKYRSHTGRSRTILSPCIVVSPSIYYCFSLGVGREVDRTAVYYRQNYSIQVYFAIWETSIQCSDCSYPLAN